jgi:hypothetical protein
MTKIGDEKSEALAGDLVWGLASIGQEIGRDPRQTFHMAQARQIPACKVGGRWCASRAALRRHFGALLAGNVA